MIAKSNLRDYELCGKTELVQGRNPLFQLVGYGIPLCNKILSAKCLLKKLDKYILTRQKKIQIYGSCDPGNLVFCMSFIPFASLP